MSARRPWAWPLVPLYAAGLRLKQIFARAPQPLAWPVVSIGSLSAGGAGKTPLTIALAKLLMERGWHVDILSRGYGRSGKAVELVHPAEPDAAARFGDEPVLLAQRTGADVWVGARRQLAGAAAEDAFLACVPDRSASDAPTAETPPSLPAFRRCVHLLDDGFQHRQLARNVDVVLVTLEDLNDTMLPAGNLREPLRALERADAVAVRMDEREAVIRRLKPWLRAGTSVWIVRRRVRFHSPLAMLGAGLRPLAFCALARPGDFASSVQAAGCGLVDTMTFPDHHAYTLADMDEIVQTAQRLNVSGFLTSEKDAVKLTPEMHARLAEIGPLLIAKLDADFGDPEQVVELLDQRCASALEHPRTGVARGHAR